MIIFPNAIYGSVSPITISNFIGKLDVFINEDNKSNAPVMVIVH